MEKKNKNKINREVVKSLIFKALHIIGYFSTALLIILAIAMGVNSFNSNKRRSAVVRNTENDISERIELDNPTSYTHYWSRYYGVNFLSVAYNTFTLSNDQQSTLWNTYMYEKYGNTNVVHVATGTPAPEDKYVSFSTPGMYILTSGSNYLICSNIYFYWQPYFMGTLQNSDFYQYNVASIRMRVVDSEGLNHNFSPIRNMATAYNVYDNYRSYGKSTNTPLPAPDYEWYGQIFATNLGVQLPGWFTYFYNNYNKVISTTFDTFNPNGLVGFSSDNAVFLSQDWENSYHDYTFINDSGFIISNGKVFDEIRLHYVKLSPGSTYADKTNSNGYSTISGTSYTWYFDSMSYYNSAYPLDHVRVCYRGSGMYGGMAGPSYEIIWNDIGYKDVYYYALTDLAYQSTMEGVQLLGTLTPGSGSNNIFDLLTLAFSSIIPVFNQTIIPGFTIGALMSIPLVGMVIFAIVKLLKK